MFTYGARPRSADCTTPSARFRIEPRVFLSLEPTLVALAGAFACFFAMFGFRANDENVFFQFFFDFLAAVVLDGVRDCRLLLGNFHEPGKEILLASITGVLDCRNGARYLTKIPQEDLAAFAFLFYALAAIEINRELSSDGLQGEPELLHDFRIGGNRFLRLASERDPDAGHMNHHGDRSDRELAARLRQSIGAPVVGDHGLRDGARRRLELERNAVGITQYLHGLPFAQVYILHRIMQLGNFLFRKFRRCLPHAQLRLGKDLFGARRPDPVEGVDQELTERASVAGLEEFDQRVERNLLGWVRAAISKTNFDRKRITAIYGGRAGCRGIEFARQLLMQTFENQPFADRRDAVRRGCADLRV